MRPEIYHIKNPNDPDGKWLVLKSWMYTLSMIVTNNGSEEPQLPFGQTESPDVAAGCDHWLRTQFKKEKTSINDRPPVPFRPWMWARILVAEEFIDDQVESHAKAPPRDNLTDALEWLLITHWHEHLARLWLEFSYDGKQINFRDRMVIWRPGRQLTLADESDDSAVTWSNLQKGADMLALAMCQLADRKLPYDQMPTPEIDRKCDSFLKKFFTTGLGDSETFLKKTPPDLAPWLAARFIVANGLALGNKHYNPYPPTEKALWIALRNIVITQWNAGAKRLWMGFYEQEDGKVAFRGDPTVEYLQKKGVFFSKN